MVAVCLNFQIHQPYRLRTDYNFFCIGRDHNYEDSKTNRDITRKVADRCYIPTNRMMLDLIRKHKGRFRISYSISGVCLEQLEKYAPEVIDSFKELVNTGCVEMLNETYYHSLAFNFSRQEFHDQVLAHQDKILRLFGVRPSTFRNTELIYSNDVALEAEKMGFTAILAEGANQILGWHSPNYMYQPDPCSSIGLLLRNYRLSDDIAFRFSDRNWEEWPLSSGKYAGWIHKIAGSGEVVNLFMDYETFGEHQDKDTGILDFFHKLPSEILRHPDFKFQTPLEVVSSLKPAAKLDVPYFISWADVERDLTAWTGNSLQDSAIQMAYSLEAAVKKSNDTNLIHAWRKLLTSDHFYYMCTKWFSDGDVHKYFNPYTSPYDAYVVYINVINDIKETLKQYEVLN
ncbi:MAG: alpha-amylase [Lentisphaerae bacterium RIFOXYA12_FULL_48_11]|nr:MAG: alpha-amylase [Lentisphaerae bacterium RIFOXYA12_FULL_48_11]